MAFNTNKSARNSAAADDSWKASAFLNIYLPMKSGARRKLGVIALKDSKDLDRAVIKRLTEGNEDEQLAALKACISSLEFDFQLATAETSSEDLAF